MVLIVDDWREVAHNAQYCRTIFYMVEEYPGGTRVRVSAGNCAFDEVFTNDEEKELNELLKWLKNIPNKTKIKGSVPLDVFFAKGGK